MRLRQIALVAEHLAPTVEGLCDVLGLEVGFRDPGVAIFGLENAVLPVGDTFLEVVSPVREDASAARFLRRRGDGGYMVIVQTDDLAADRRRLESLEVRVVWETSFPDIATVHLHPRDVGGAILSLDEARPPDSWRWAGPDWQAKVRTGVVTRILGAELQCPEPEALAARWSGVLGRPATPASDGSWQIALDGGGIRFVALRDDRGEGLAGLSVATADPTHAKQAAGRRSLQVEGDAIQLCGTWIRLVPASDEPQP